MKESSALNHKKGIRAAVVHDKYIAEMCRKVSSGLYSIMMPMCVYWAWNASGLDLAQASRRTTSAVPSTIKRGIC